MDVGTRSRAADRPDRLGLSDLVVLADKAQDGPVDVGEGQRSSVDDHAAGQHPVLCDELPQCVGERRSRPGDPAFRLDKAPLTLVGQQRFAIVQLPEEFHPRLHILYWIEQPKAFAGSPSGQSRAVQ